MKRIGWSTFRKIYWPLLLLLFLALPVTLVVSGRTESLVPLSVNIGVFLFWLIFGRRIAYRLVPFVVRSVECPGCHEDIDAVGVWDCACGFNDHRTRHLLRKRCPNCGCVTSRVNCPRCNCTILVW